MKNAMINILKQRGLLFFSIQAWVALRNQIFLEKIDKQSGKEIRRKLSILSPDEMANILKLLPSWIFFYDIDKEEDLANMLMLYHQNQDEYKDQSFLARREVVSNFSLDTMVQKYEQQY